MAHIFVSPHPDDAALSCGGLIANLRELGQNVVILSVYSGHGSLDARAHSQLAQNRLDMQLDGAVRDIEGARDHLVALPLGQMLQDFQLTRAFPHPLLQRLVGFLQFRLRAAPFGQLLLEGGVQAGIVQGDGGQLGEAHH